MKIALKTYILLLISAITVSNLKAQDTIFYHGFLKVAHKRYILYETIELYSDSTFKWASEYDLGWNEYGFYQIEDNILILNFTKYDFNNDNLSNSLPIRRTEKYEIADNRLFKLNQNGRRITTQKDKSFRTKWGWLSGYKYKYEIKKYQNYIFSKE